MMFMISLISLIKNHSNHTGLNNAFYISPYIPLNKGAQKAGDRQ